MVEEEEEEGYMMRSSRDGNFIELNLYVAELLLVQLHSHPLQIAKVVLRYADEVFSASDESEDDSA